MNFGQALIAIKKGCKVTRNGWYDKAHIRFYNSYKDKHFTLSEVPTISGYTSPWIESKDATKKFVPYIVYVDRENNIFTWLPTQEDILRKDWTILK